LQTLVPNMETPEQRLQRHCRQVMELQMRSGVTPKPDGGPHEQLVAAIIEGIAPSIKKHVAREVAAATAPVIARIARLESEQRAAKPRRPAKLRPRKAVKCFEPAKRIGPVKCMF
jgi:hypothetical protein